MTNDDLKRFYPINSNPERKEDFARYDENGKISGAGDGNLEDLNYKDVWIQGMNIQSNDVVYEDENNIRTYYLALKNFISEVKPSEEESGYWKIWLKVKTSEATGGLVIETETTTELKGYQVPVLTAEQIIQIYNAKVTAITVTVTDPTGNYHFDIDQADNMSGVISVEYKFFNTMYVTYSLENDTVTIEGELIGGGQLYRHDIIIEYTYVSIVTNSSEVFTTQKLAKFYYELGFTDINHTFGSGRTRCETGTTLRGIITYDCRFYCPNSTSINHSYTRYTPSIIDNTLSYTSQQGNFAASVSRDVVTPL